MKLASTLLIPLALAACPASDPADPDPATQPDAGVDSPPPEPKPAFTASSYVDGDIAVDDAGIRSTYKVGLMEKKSLVYVSLTDTATKTDCTVKLAPKFVEFGHSSTSTRQFKTVIIDFAGSTVVEDGCKWDDAWITSGLDAQLGHYIVGFAQARFTEDRPYLDIYLNCEKGLGNDTASITRAGAGTAYGMNPDGAITATMVEPMPGTLVPALYKF